MDPFPAEGRQHPDHPAAADPAGRAREGIIINSAEMRLYYYPKGSNTVVVLPIGIGQLGKDTPLNWTTTVQRKKDGPTWTPTAKMRAEYAADGEILPAVFPAGPDNPMGLYALYVGRLYAIHGTNANFGIGLRVSHGCVRLRADDIKYLFENVPVGTRVAVHQRTDESHRRTGRLALRGSAQPAVGQRRAAAIQRSGAADHLRAGRQSADGRRRQPERSGRGDQGPFRYAGEIELIAFRPQ